jgi:hypothetical protein
MIPDLINKLFEDGLILKEQYESLSPLKKPYDKKLGNFLVEGGFLTQEVLKTFVVENDNFLFELFDQWLRDNSDIAKAIIWRADGSKRTSNGVSRAYHSWSKVKKLELSSTFWRILLDLQSGLSEVPPSTVNLYDEEVFSTNLVPEDAWKYYLAYIASGLRVELDKLVHWSIFRYNKKQLELLFDSRSFFEYFQSRDVYSILRCHDSLFNHGSATLGDPVRIYDFLDDKKLIGITRWGTVGRFLGWCRDNLVHFKDGNTPENYLEYWQYEGYPPVERIISGTEHFDLGFQHFTAGCWGTTGFLRTVLRTINIPVVLEERCGHALPHFVYDTKHEFYLSHGDDPYNSLYKHSTPQFIPLELIIDHYKFDRWFNRSLPEETICNNIGRHALELAEEYVPNEILKIYCDDISKGKTHEEGRIYNEIFRDHISLKELNAFRFWDQMKNKIDEYGGCNKLLSQK